MDQTKRSAKERLKIYVSSLPERLASIAIEMAPFPIGNPVRHGGFSIPTCSSSFHRGKMGNILGRSPLNHHCERVMVEWLVVLDAITYIT